MARAEQRMEVSATGAITVVDSVEEQIDKLPSLQQVKLRQIMHEQTVLAGYMKTLHDEISHQERILRQNPIWVQIREKKGKFKRAQSRFQELTVAFNGIFDLVTDDGKNTSVYSRYEAIFREMDEEDELIRKAEQANRKGLKS